MGLGQKRLNPTYYNGGHPSTTLCYNPTDDGATTGTMTGVTNIPTVATTTVSINTTGVAFAVATIAIAIVVATVAALVCVL